jgi:3-methyladenine DNA glycosylase/8-oxoguanine DNA glycosylase
VQQPVDLPVRTLYAPDRPVNLAQTLSHLRRGTADPTFRTDASGTWRTQRTPQGAATLHLVAEAGGVRATAWGPGAEWSIAQVPELLGAGDDWTTLDVASVPLLADSLRRNPGLRLTRTGLVYEAMLAAVLEQKVTGVEARRAWRYLLHTYGEVPPGPAPAGMRVFPGSEVWRRVPSWEWHKAGVGPQRADTVMRVTSVSSSLERTLDLGRGGAEVERKLRSVIGIGVWTAAETMQRAHGDGDSPSVGDYHLPALAGWALIGKPVDDDGMLELLEPWRGHRQRVMRLITASGFVKPKFGPRMTIQDHRAN